MRDSRQLVLDSEAAMEESAARAKPTRPLPAAQVAAMAKRAIARQTKPDPSGSDRVSLTVAVILPRAKLEALTVRAIREGKALRGLINELLAAAAERETL